MFDWQQALKLGLVDKLGYFKDAVAEAIKLAGIEGTYAVIRYEESFSFARFFDLMSSKAQPVSISLRGESSNTFHPQKGRLYYLPSDF